MKRPLISAMSASRTEKLVTSFLGETFHVSWQDEVNSTMETAREYIVSGGSSPAVLGADFQQNGRGRRGTKWESANDAILMTLAIPQSEVVVESNFITLAVGLGVLRSVQKYSTDFRCKWPNDIVTQNGNKLSGILAETITQPETGERWFSIGIGFNFCGCPEFAASLSMHSDEFPEREIFIGELVTSVTKTLKIRDSESLIEAVRQNLYLPIISPQKFEYEGALLEIIVTGIGSDGALMAVVDGKERSFVTGHFLGKRG